jgi:ribonuclease VapC
LNFGDCFSYALATSRDEPLLFTGEDFLQTDVKVAAPPADWDPLASAAS